VDGEQNGSIFVSPPFVRSVPGQLGPIGGQYSTALLGS
jgi:hypothetical protein